MEKLIAPRVILRQALQSGPMASAPRWNSYWPFRASADLGASAVRLAAHADPSTGSSRFIVFRRCQVRDRPSGKGKSKPFYRFDTPRKYAETIELEWAGFYHKAAQSARDSSIRELLDRLADAEDEHESLDHKLAETILTKPARAREDETSRRLFVLQYVQPGLAGLMDGSVSTLAPLFAAAFATH